MAEASTYTAAQKQCSGDSIDARVLHAFRSL